MKPLILEHNDAHHIERHTDGLMPVNWTFDRDRCGCWRIAGTPVWEHDKFGLDELMLLAVKTHYRVFDLSGSEHLLHLAMTAWGKMIGKVFVGMPDTADMTPTAAVHRLVRTLLKAIHVPFTSTTTDNTLHYVLHTTPLRKAASRHTVTLDHWHLNAFETFLRGALEALSPTLHLRLDIAPHRSIGYVHIDLPDGRG